MQPIVTDSSDFKDLRLRDAYYIDKTPQIKEFFELSSKIILMPRPRRFGKTLFLSTMKYLFSNKIKEKELFKNTAIYDTNFFNDNFGKYPVISLTFKDVKESSFELMIEGISNELISVYREYEQEIINSNKIDEKNILLRVLNNKASISDLTESLKSLSIILTNYYNTPTIILIDEYDTPIINAYLEGYYDKAIKFFKSMLGAALKGNDLNIKKALLAGILRISKESMFSDLNNLKVYTILDKPLSTSCGFTKEETIKLLDDYNITGKTKQKALNWYNSYTFGDEIITNPWSLLNFVEEGIFKPYWANTASNDFIYDLVQNSKSFQENLDRLITGDSIDIKVNENITLRDKDLYEKDNLFSFLFFSGYLKCIEKYYVKNVDKQGLASEHLHCKLVPVNGECKMIFEDVISKYVNNSFNNENINNILQALISGNLRLFEKLFSYLLRDTVSYFDTKNENSYHMFLLGILVNLSGEYEIISNTEAGYGRVDIILLHKTNKEKLAIVMELKEIEEFYEETKDEALNLAVKQIKEQEYISLAKKRGYNNILAFGLVFDGKRCWVKIIEN